MELSVRSIIMTIKELKDQLEQFDDNLIVMVPNKDYYLEDPAFPDVVAKHVYRRA